MSNLNRRFSGLTSLMILLAMSIATSYLFFFATKIQAVAESWDEYEISAYQAAGIDVYGGSLQDTREPQKPAKVREL